ncbi:MAG: archaeal heat shock protein Hsp20 [Candidatus Bathyarchaeia archaeon]
MSSDEFLPEWFRSRRGRQSPFGWMDRWFSDVDEMFGNMFQDMLKGMPKDMMTERKLPDGSTVKQYGPFVYGYSMSIGPDGKPNVQEFGNVKPSRRPGAFGIQQPALEPKETREPLVDVINEQTQVRVVAELPGVEKSDIKTSINEDQLTIKVDSPTQKYYKEVKLPTGVDPDSSKASYNNGVLEITLRKMQPRPKGKEIKID